MKRSLTFKQLKKLLKEELKDEPEEQSVELAVTEVTPDKIAAAEKVLADNGVDKSKVDTVLQAIGYALLDTDIYFG